MRQTVVILVLCLAAVFTCKAQNRHALLIGISEYPAESGWSKIHATNDVKVVKDALQRIDREFDITTLEDSKATYASIKGALKVLAEKVKHGDECVILFSCHGQLITDLDEDEAARNERDHYDEAIVPYNGENHLKDDEINALLGDIFNAVGDKGQLIVLFDACHSGDMSRDTQPVADEEFLRGSASAFRIQNDGHNMSAIHREEAPVRWIAFSACDSEHSNYEVCIDGIWYGRLAYAFAKEIQKGLTGDELAAHIQEAFKTLPTNPDRPVQVPSLFVPNNMKHIYILK